MSIMYMVVRDDSSSGTRGESESSEALMALLVRSRMTMETAMGRLRPRRREPRLDEMPTREVLPTARDIPALGALDRPR